MDSAKEQQGRILLVDDESAILRTFRYCLEDEGYTVATANSAAQADALLQRQVFDLCFLDLRLGEDNGLDVLAQMRIQAPWMRVVIVTAHSAVDTAVDAIQAGAADYLVKPCSPDQLRLATAKPTEVSWHLPESIDFKRLPTDPQWERHLYVEGDGQFRAELGTWESGVLKEELAKPEVIGWLRNLDRKPWSLEIPYETGGDIRPMFPDLVIVRKVGADTTVDILEPHDPSLGDNFEKAVGLARFAERHGALFGRIQMIRKQSSPAGGEHYARLEINKETTIKQLLLVTSNPQLDALFSSLAT